MDKGKKGPYGVKVIGTDSYLADENVAYLIDYSVKSPVVDGGSSKGSLYIRGVKGNEGWDSFKFIMEKHNDFSPFDAEIVINAYEKAFTPRPGQEVYGDDGVMAKSTPQAVITENMSPA